MATITFSSTEPAAEARAIVSTLSMWLHEQPRPEQALPAKARFTYDGDDLRTVTVTLVEDGEK
ncbi:hypothetical protein [Pseudomonas putida]|uniref:hypothetical protein n=1 Tax=Pseudomonas putida TaxID=303 RepID=UPI003D97C8A5